jgi:hypothetical protein
MTGWTIRLCGGRWEVREEKASRYWLREEREEEAEGSP